METDKPAVGDGVPVRESGFVLWRGVLTEYAVFRCYVLGLLATMRKTQSLLHLPEGRPGGNCTLRDLGQRGAVVGYKRGLAVG